MRVALSRKCRTSVYHSAMPGQNERFATWFTEQLARKEWEQADFARYANTSTANTSRWNSGVIPAAENIALIARTFGVAVEDIYRAINGEVSTTSPRSPEDILAELEANQPVAVPVIRDLVAHMGSGGGFIDDYVFLSPMYRRRRKKNLLSIVARGDCMEPQIADGDVVVFDRDASWQPNNLVVAAVDGQAQVRRFVDVRGTPMLKADADGSLHTLSEADQIFGRVVYVMRPLMPLDETA